MVHYRAVKKYMELQIVGYYEKMQKTKLHVCVHSRISAVRMKTEMLTASEYLTNPMEHCKGCSVVAQGIGLVRSM